MYANFLYFIISLLILSLYQPVDHPRLSLLPAFTVFAFLFFAFALYTHAVFQRSIRLLRYGDHRLLDQMINRLSTRHSIIALTLFGIDVWVLDLPTFLKSIPLFKALPTLSDLAFLLVFIGYLAIIWYIGFSAQQKIVDTRISRSTYVYSNFAFSIPILIPYALLSGILDILLLLPFEWPRRILDTTIGQTGYFLFFLVMAALFAPVLVQRFWRCRPLEAGAARRRIEDLCSKSGVYYADIVYWPIFGGHMITAGVMGLVSRFRYILVTKALLHLLHPEEVDQVIAHEIGHVKRRHLLLYLLFFIGFMIISYAVTISGYYLVFLNVAVIKLMFDWGLNPETVFQAASSGLLIVTAIIYFRYLFGYFMRNFERQADSYVFQLFPSAQPLINTFGKIVSSSGQSADQPNWHHFSIRQRVEFLRRCEASPDHINRHERKMRNSLAAYLAGVVILGMAVFQFNQFLNQRDDQWRTLSNLEEYLDSKSSKKEQDALLYLMIGNLYYSRQQTRQAAAAYEKGLALNPNQADILNNLAWLLATPEGDAPGDPARALTLARRAIELQQAPHIWDTLAQSLFNNGFVQEAIEAERNALAMNPADRRIYEDQLKKFEQAGIDREAIP